MKCKVSCWEKVFGVFLCAFAAVCLFSSSAFAAAPGTLDVSLTYAGVTSAGTGVNNGDPVNSGFAALLEDNMQVDVAGQALTPILGGVVSFSYPFDPAKSYTVSVQEAKTEPYYEAKNISVSASTISAAISTGASIADTVNWVQWSKPITIILEDPNGFPAPAGTKVTLTGTDADPINPTYQVFSVTKKTNADGEVRFLDFSFDPSDPSMTNIAANQVFATATYADPATGAETSITQFFPLTNTNVLSMVWPNATVSGTVRGIAGQAVANQPVSVYYDLPAPATMNSNGSFTGPALFTFENKYSQQIKNPYYDPNYPFPDVPEYISADFDVGKLHLNCRVYSTTTDENGKYTLALPQMEQADLCLDDTSLPPEYYENGSYALGYYSPGTLNSDSMEQNRLLNMQYFFSASDFCPFLGYNLQSSVHQFRGLRCLESVQTSVVPYGNLSGYDLVLGTYPYTLKGEVFAGDTLYKGKITFTLSSRAPSSVNNLHSGELVTSLSYDITDGKIEKTDAKLTPGTYKVTISVTPEALSNHIADYSFYTKEITAADIADDRIVDLGTMTFLPIEFTTVSGPGKPLDVPVPPTTPAGPGYGYVQARLDGMIEPSYGNEARSVTLHYQGFHTNAAVNKVTNAQLVLHIPAGLDVVSAGGMTVTQNSSTGGADLSQTIPTLPTGAVHDITIVVKKTASATSNYYAITCDATDNDVNGTTSLQSITALQFDRVTLSTPRLVEEGTSFTAFGDITGGGETGVDLIRDHDAQVFATGAKKGRYYYITVPGQKAKSDAYRFYAQIDRNGTLERSPSVSVLVGNGLPVVEDMSIVCNGMTFPKNPKFNMVYFTGFTDPSSLKGPSFEVHFKLKNNGANLPCSVRFNGKDYPATLTNGEYVATISGYYAYGDFDLSVVIDSTYESQIGRVLLLF